MLKPATEMLSDPLVRKKTKKYHAINGETLTTEVDDTSYGLAKNFTKVGSLFNKNNPMNIFKLTRNMTKSEIKFIIALFDSVGGDFKAHTFDYDLSGFSHSEKNAANKAFNLLKKKGLVKRVGSKAKYMINPALFIPFEEEEADELWVSLP